MPHYLKSNLALHGLGVPLHVPLAGALVVGADHVDIHCPAPSSIRAREGRMVQAMPVWWWWWGGGAAALAPHLAEPSIALTKTPLTVGVGRTATQTFIPEQLLEIKEMI